MLENRDIILKLAEKYPDISIAELHKICDAPAKFIKIAIRNDPGCIIFLSELGEFGPSKKKKFKLGYKERINKYRKAAGYEDRTPGTKHLREEDI